MSGSNGLEARSQFRSAEMKLASVSPSTSSDLASARRYVSIPYTVRGLRILDVGTGASTAVLELRNQGAKALGIEIRYRDVNELRESVDTHIADPNTYEQIKARTPFTPEVKRREIFDQAISKMKADSNTFFEAWEKGNKPYLAGRAGKLSFRKDVFDLVYSIECVSMALIGDLEVFVQVFFENMRVLMPGKELQYAPWFKQALPGRWSTFQAQNAAAFLQGLHRTGYAFRIEPMSDLPDHFRLRVTKPKPQIITDTKSNKKKAKNKRK